MADAAAVVQKLCLYLHAQEFVFLSQSTCMHLLSNYVGVECLLCY
jgi:hypothetical protein